MKKLRYIFLVLVLGSILIITACGGGETTNSTTTVSPAATTPFSTPAKTESTTAVDTNPPSVTTTEPTTTEPMETTATATPEATTIPEPEELKITSPAFEEGGVIPVKYSCDGQDISPELNWTGIPQGTKSLALILDDPDAPGGTFTHWVIFNIPADATGLEENVSKTGTLASDAVQGINNFATLGYGGPCPPTGSSHRYYFTLYALDTTIDLASGSTKTQLLASMEGHILAEAEIMGNFQS